MAHIIRDAREGDGPALAAIYGHAVAHTTASYAYLPPLPQEMAAQVAARRAEGMAYIVAEVGGQVQGYAYYLQFRPREGYRYTLESSVYIAPSAQGQGLGTALMQELIKRARAGGYKSIIAGMDAENGGSLQFHKALGFVQVGRLQQVGYKFDRWLDVIFTQLELR